MMGQLKHQKRPGKMEPMGFNVAGTHGHQGLSPSIQLTSVYNNDDCENLYLRYDLSPAEARKLAAKLVEMASCVEPH